MTRSFKVNPEFPDAAIIIEAAALLRAGRLVAFPTETVYGLGADATSAEAVRAIFAAKERDASDPLIVHIAVIEQLAAVASGVPLLARFLIERFWPGPLTIVLERGPAIAPEVSAGGATVAVRMPSHQVARALISAAGLPIAAPSANRFTRTSATTAAHVLEDLDGRVDLILDGGPATAGIESTVVSFDDDGRTVRVLREGAVTVEALRAALAQRNGAQVAMGRGDGPVAAPGQMAKHYAPRKPLTYVVGDDGAADTLLRLVKHAIRTGRRPGVLACAEDAHLFGSMPGVEVKMLGPRSDGERVARQLFATLRVLDAGPADVLFARQFAVEGVGAAVHDRLTRAATTVVDAGHFG